MKSKLITALAPLAIAIMLSGCGGQNPFADISGEWIDPANGGKFEVTPKGEFIIKSGVSPQTYSLTAKGPNQFEYTVANSGKTVSVMQTGETLQIGDVWKAVPYPWPAAGKYVWAEENETITLNSDYTLSFGEAIRAKCVISGDSITLNFTTDHPDELPEGMTLQLRGTQVVWNQDGDELVFEKATE